MEFIIFLTERCNLECTYCGEGKARSDLQPDISYKASVLIDFLQQAPDVALHLYGGEPLLNVPLLEAILTQVESDSVTVQTNGLLLDRLPEALWEKISLLSVSLDGSPATTNGFRGDGTQEKVLAQVAEIRRRGFPNEIHARMTTSPGVDIYDSVTYFTERCPAAFDAVHWQLNVLFAADDAWHEDRDAVKRWFAEDYNPGISALMDYWYGHMRKRGKVLRLVPFVTMMDSILEETPVDNVRCGAGWQTWSIGTNGDIFPCPVMSSYPEFRVGNIADTTPSDIKPTCELQEPCPSCDVFGHCGGRCLCSNLRNLWDEEGFDIVCGSIKHLVAELARVAPGVRQLIADGAIDPDDFGGIQFHEITP
jgi:uncharacterized protein